MSVNQRRLSFSRKVARVIREKALISTCDTVVVAVSGGVDSVALLDYLASRSDLSLSIVVAHLNHSLRGAESDGDEEFVRGVAQRYGVRIVTRHMDVASFARGKGVSLEEGGREARYYFFAEVAREVGAQSVALAHHRDDQAETVLLRLLRGSGMTGLRGMAYRSGDGLYIRPFLDLARAEIEDYAASRKLPFRIDSSNSDSSFLRNRVRNELLPHLRGYNPAIARRLADTATIMAADEALLSQTVERRWQEVGTIAAGHLLLDVAAVSTDMVGMRLRLYRSVIERVKGSLRRISYAHLTDIDRLLMTGAPNGRLDLPDRLTVIRSYGELIFSCSGNRIPEEIREMEIASFGGHELSSGWRIMVEECSGQTTSQGKMVLVADLAQFPFPWTVRGYRPGDRIALQGMTGHKKVKDLFIDEKIPWPRRRNIPLFFSGNTLFWVGGVRTAPLAQADSPDLKRVKVELLEIAGDVGILP